MSVDEAGEAADYGTSWKRHGLRSLGWRPMSKRMEVTNLYQCRGERPKPYNVFLSIQKTSFFASGLLEGGFMMVFLFAGNWELQKAFLQSPCLRRRQFLVVTEVRMRREEYCSNGEYFSLFAQRQFSRFPRTTMRDLARSGSVFSSLLIFMTHMDGIALGTPLGRRRRQHYSWR